LPSAPTRQASHTICTRATGPRAPAICPPQRAPTSGPTTSFKPSRTDPLKREPTAKSGPTTPFKPFRTDPLNREPANVRRALFGFMIRRPGDIRGDHQQLRPSPSSIADGGRRRCSPHRKRSRSTSSSSTQRRGRLRHRRLGTISPHGPSVRSRVISAAFSARPARPRRSGAMRFQLDGGDACRKSSWHAIPAGKRGSRVIWTR
jgi:hypothetical protein